MSLINDALKKAQMEGGGKAAPAVRNPDVASAAFGARRPKVARVAVLGVAVVAVVGGVGYYVLGNDEPAPVVAVARAQKVARVVPEVASKPPVPVAPAAAAPVSPSAPDEASTNAAATPVAPAIVASAAATIPAPVVPAVPVRNPDVEDTVGRMHLSLVRKKTGRCVIDGVVYKTGDRVSTHPEISIRDITDLAVVFSDGNGVEYEKKYK